MTAGFERGVAREEEAEATERKMAQLYEQIGRLTLHVNWLKKNLASTQSRSERLALLEWESTPIPLSVQADLLSVSRSSLYYQPKAPEPQEVAIKHRLDALYTEHPCLGSRKLVALLSREGIVVGRHTLRRYRAEMGLETLYPKPNLSKPSRVEHVVYPYLLRHLLIERPNQVWGVDITYIRMTRGWMYLVAFLDWYSRYVVAWELSDSLELPFVVSGSGAGAIRIPDRELGSGEPLHQRALHESASGRGCENLDGRVRSLYGQHFHGATLAFGEIRGGLSKRVCYPERSEGRIATVFCVL